MNEKVVLGFSGGVDSTAAAVLLKNKGFEVIALYFDVLPAADIYAMERAKEVARLLDIKFEYRNLSEEFNRQILSIFKDDYRNGRTPMPCIFCNPQIKFKVLKDCADQIGAAYIATGHYAKVIEDQGIYYVSHAKNNQKDQSYMLARLEQDLLKRVIFPLGEYENKETIRNIVKEYKLPNSDDKDSQDICFIPDGDYRSFLLKNGFKAKEGFFKDKNGNILGTHNGSFNFTIGQRKGLGIAIGKPAFVTAIDSETNTVIIGDDADLYKNFVAVNKLFFTEFGPCDNLPDKFDGKKVKCKLRYAAKEAECKVNAFPHGATLSFELSQRAPTPGQAAVFYENDKVIGSAIIL